VPSDDPPATGRSLRLWAGVLVLLAGVVLVGLHVDVVHRSYDARVVPGTAVEADDAVTPRSAVGARTWRALRGDGYETTEYQVGVGPTHVATVGVDRDGASLGARPTAALLDRTRYLRGDDGHYRVVSHADERGAPDAWASVLGAVLAFLGAGAAYVGPEGD
jgi:hypothetical protein